MPKYATGKFAWGRCARSGRRMKLLDMVADGNYPGLMVDPDWRDIKNEQERPIDVSDAIALRRPAPDTDDDSAGAGSSLATALFSGQNIFGGGT